MASNQASEMPRIPERVGWDVPVRSILVRPLLTKCAIKVSDSEGESHPQAGDSAPLAAARGVRSLAMAVLPLPEVMRSSDGAKQLQMQARQEKGATTCFISVNLGIY